HPFYTLSLHDALPISLPRGGCAAVGRRPATRSRRGRGSGRRGTRRQRALRRAVPRERVACTAHPAAPARGADAALAAAAEGAVAATGRPQVRQLPRDP